MQKQKLPPSYAARLSEYDLDELDLSGAVLLKFDRGEWLLNEGHPIGYLYFLLSGKASVSSSAENGRRLLLCYYISDGIIGDIELITSRKNAISSMQAITPLICIGLPLERYAPKLLANPKFVLRAAEGIAEKLNDSVRNCTETILKPFEQRLCIYILQSAQDGFFHETLTNVADQLGSSYRHLLRCLQRLCEEGLLDKRKGGYFVLDSEALEKRAMD